MERDWHGEARTHRPGSAFPYTTTHITGKPVEVQSLAHLRQLEKRHGVVQRDDNAWLTRQYKGINYKTGAQIYKEGSGYGGGFKGSNGTWF